jgi:hypothetical protein
VKLWRARRARHSTEVFIPLVFAPGEAYQFDWSYETVELDGEAVSVQVAQFRLCHSRHYFVRRMATGLPRPEDDHRAAQSNHPSLRHRGNRQRVLALQASRLGAAAGQTGTELQAEKGSSLEAD